MSFFLKMTLAWLRKTQMKVFITIRSSHHPNNNHNNNNNNHHNSSNRIIHLKSRMAIVNLFLLHLYNNNSNSSNSLKISINRLKRCSLKKWSKILSFFDLLYKFVLLLIFYTYIHYSYYIILEFIFLNTFYIY